jgi:hypothetical protein
MLASVSKPITATIIMRRFGRLRCPPVPASRKESRCRHFGEQDAEMARNRRDSRPPRSDTRGSSR